MPNNTPIADAIIREIDVFYTMFPVAYSIEERQRLRKLLCERIESVVWQEIEKITAATATDIDHSSC